MLAARLYGPNQLRFEQVPVPELEEGEALIRIAACGVCPSDVRLFTGNARLPVGKVPFLAGHEWVGEVVSVRVSGPIQSAIRPGARVAACWLSSCGECEFCRRGYPNYCVQDNRARVTGGFAEYGKAPVTSLWELPASLAYEEAVFAEPLACCVNGQERSRIAARDEVLVIGAGPVGLLHAQLAHVQGARVIVCDLAAERLEIARGLGIEETLLIGDVTSPSMAYRLAAERVRKMTEGKGPDKVIVATNSVDAVSWALEVIAPCGILNVFAGLYPESHLSLDLNAVHYKQVTITGSHDFNHTHFDAAVNLIVRGRVNVRKLISHVVPLAELEEAFRIVAQRRGMKVVVSPDRFEPSRSL
ncbi:MAG: alcohol dehydrogenase catalytic domain-containing protein [Firmicutes bacterium]|jgi:L-iditol 2-dehydrogenase|nr:alcohol dehydrogenase catalytic domain-containing protein [Bacillota bacterium]MDH7495457.1 alcohol dehydrogenase catalytic domain-containing protein [Bacillota bacterium]